MRVMSIFNSIDGEVNLYGQGAFSTFVRLAGCNLKCHYCDTSKSQAIDSGKEMTVHSVVNQIQALGCKKVTITGGEPLLHEEDLSLLVYYLYLDSYKITLETNGTLPIPKWAKILINSIVMDYKIGISSIDTFDKRSSIDDVGIHLSLSEKDWIKIPIWDDFSYQAALFIYYHYLRGNAKARIAFSAIEGEFMNTSKLVELMRKDKLFDIVVNTQIHKYIWPGSKEEV